MIKLFFTLIFAGIIFMPPRTCAQSDALFIPQNIREAYNNKTRAMDGKPGPAYWQNRADYTIDVELDPINRILSGSEEIFYYNNSPDTLNEMIIHLFPNIYKKGNSREFVIDPSDESEGVVIEEIVLNKRKLDISSESKSIEYIHSDFRLFLDNALYPHKKIKLDISWRYTVNKKSHMRTGTVDSSTFFIAYFFPRVAVYDDIDGWNESKYSGITEFYNDFGNYDVSITVPQNFIVWATGTLQNHEEVLQKKYAQRYKSAFSSDDIIHIIDSSEYANFNITKPNAKNVWKFRAENVTDFAFATSDHYLWDATSLIVDKSTGRRVFIDAAYNKDSEDFYEVAKITRQSIKYMSYEIPGIPFPFPKETIFNGLDEMEYPMMVNDMSVDDHSYLIKLTSHEISHSYFPFYMGINETKYAWMDEGWASYFDYLICSAIDAPEKASIFYLDKYQNHAGLDLNMPMASLSNYLKRPTYHYNSYAKPAVFYLILHDLLGDELFKKSLHEYIRRWNGKHPIPYDFFFTFNEASGQNLNWLFNPWFFEFGYVDFGIKDVSRQSGKYKIVIEKLGKYPAPIRLKITYEDESTDFISETASVWRDGSNIYIIEKPHTKTIKIVELYDQMIPDADLKNNIYKIQ